MDGGEDLAGGNLSGGVARVGDTVRRPAGPWTPSVHRLLDHLETKGFDAPRAIGLDDEGRESLSYIPGVTAHPHRPGLFRRPAALHRVGRLIGSFHAAQAGFAATSDDVWREEGHDPTRRAEILAHNDLAPWNLVVDGSRWVFIDWDLAAPGRRFWDLAWALQSFCALWPDELADDAEAAMRTAAFCDGAAVSTDTRPELFTVTVERTATHAQDLRRRAAGGSASHEKLVADGHAERWELAAEFVSSRWRRWLSP